MKKYVALILAFSLTLALAGCGGKDDAGSDVKSEGVMTHAEYMAAAVDEQVVVETYVQAKQS